MKIVLGLVLISTVVFVSCGVSTLDLINDGINCKAEITLPEDRGVPVLVDVKIFNCKPIEPK